MIHLLWRSDIEKLEYDPAAQYRFHRFWTITWAATMAVIPFDPVLYAHSVSALIIQEISLWANFATHFGAMSAALAAKQTAPAKPERTTFPH